MNFKDIPFINLHAHSHYSKLDGIGTPKQYFLRCLEVGHKGACLTDHGHYAAAYKLKQLEFNEKGDKAIKKAFLEYGVNDFPVVMGSEIYMADDRAQVILENLAQQNKIEEIFTYLNQMKSNPLYESIFDSIVSSATVDFTGNSKVEKDSKKIGETLLKLEDSERDDEVIAKIIDLTLEVAKKSTSCQTNKYTHLVVMAKNEKGHQNINRMVSEAHLPGNFYLRPRVRMSRLFELKDGVMAGSACFGGPLARSIHRGVGDEEDLLKRFIDELGDDFYIELQFSDLSWDWNKFTKSHVRGESNPQKNVNNRLIELSKKFNILDNIYVTQDSHMPREEDYEKQKMMMISDSSNSAGFHFPEAYYLHSVEEMYHKMCRLYRENDSDKSIYTDEMFKKWCSNTMNVLNKVERFKIDRSIKLLEINYANHYINNPLVLNIEKVKEFSKNFPIPGNQDSFQDEDYFILNLDIKEAHLNKQKTVHGVEFDISDFIDENKTSALLLKIEQAKKDIDWLRAEFFNKEYYLTKILRDIDGDLPYVKPNSKTLTALMVALTYGRLDIKRKDHRDQFFYEFDTLQLNGKVRLVDYYMQFEEYVFLLESCFELPGPGRGSAAGSLFSYSFGITSVNPLESGLIFERFISKARIGVSYFKVNGKSAVEDTEFYHYENYKWIYDQVSKYLEKPEFKERLEEELFYLYCNPHWATLIKSEDIKSNDSNSMIVSIIMKDSDKDLLSLSGLEGTAPSLPDIDFDSSNRDLLVRFNLKYYGKEQVLAIGTELSLKVKSAIKMVLRVLGFSDSEANSVTKPYSQVERGFSEFDMAEGELHLFRVALETSSEFRQFFSKNKSFKMKNGEIVSIQDKVEEVLGIINAYGKHAAAVVPGVSLIDHCPCWFDKDMGIYVTMLDKNDAEYYGLTKNDLLGLSTLEELRDAFLMILERHNVNLFLKMEEIVNGANKEENRPIWETYLKGDTISNFQFNTPINVNMLKRLSNLDYLVFDLSTITSINRPGPMSMGMDNTFIRRKNGVEAVTYLIPEIEEELKETLGIICYQEQVMKIAVNIGGFTPFESDKLRKAMGKKDVNLLAQYGEKFIAGAVSRGINKNKAQELFDLMYAFAGYGFNKSHAFAYACLSYVSAWTRYHYEIEYVAAIFTRSSNKNGEKDKANFKIYQRKWGHLIRPPSVMTSTYRYEIKDDLIYMPLYSLKGVGKKESSKIIENRPYNSFRDFACKNKVYGIVGSGSMEKLIFAGGFDDMFYLENSIGEDKLAMIKENNIDEDLSLELISIIRKSKYSEEEESLYIIEKLENEIALDKKEIDFFLKEINESSNFSKSEFRKKKLCEYFGNYYYRKVSDSVRKKLKASLSVEDFNRAHYQILKDENLLNLQPLEIELLKDKKGGIPTKVVKNHLTKKEMGEYEEKLKDIEILNDMNIVLREVEALGFSSFNFNDHLSPIIRSCVNREFSGARVWGPDEILKMTNPIVEKYDKTLGSVNTILTMFSEESIGKIEACSMLNEVFKNLTNILNFRDIKKGIIEDKAGFFFSLIDRDLSNEILKTLSLMNFRRPKGWFFDKKVNLNLAHVIDSKLRSELSTILGSKLPELDDINSHQEITVPSESFLNLYLFLLILDGGRTGRDALLAIQGKNRENLAFVSSLITRLRINKDNRMSFLEKYKKALNINVEEIKDNFKEIINAKEENLLEKHNMSDIVFTESDQQFLKDQHVISATAFIPDDKRDRGFEYGSGIKRSKCLKYNLVNEESVIKLNIWSADKYIFTNEEEGPIEKTMKNYTPVLFRGTISINFAFNMEVSTSPKGSIRSLFPELSKVSGSFDKLVA
jgi:DNA polymerase III alpha subunit